MEGKEQSAETKNKKVKLEQASWEQTEAAEELQPGRRGGGATGNAFGSETNNTLITIIPSIILRSRRWGVSAPPAANTVSCLGIYRATKSDCRPISFHLLPPFTFMICLLGTHVCKRPLIVCGLIIEPICQSPFKLV